MNLVKFNDYIVKLRKYYWNYGVIPTLEIMKDIIGFASKDSVRRFYDEAIEEGFLEKEGKKYFPKDKLYSFNIYGSVKAGSATEVETDNIINTIKIDKYLIGGNPENVILINVSGESMIDAGINDGDTVILDKTQINPRFGDIVIASVDGENEFTLKKYEKDKNNKPYLKYENQRDYPNEVIYLNEGSKIIGTIKGLFRKF